MAILAQRAAVVSRKGCRAWQAGCGLSGNANASSNASLLSFVLPAGSPLNSLWLPGPPRNRGDLSSWNQTWARNGCHQQSEERAACPVTPHASESRHLVSMDFVPGKVAAPYSTLWLQGDWRASLGLAHGRDLGGRPGPSAAPRHSGWRGFCFHRGSGERSKDVGPPPWWLARGVQPASPVVVVVVAFVCLSL